MTYKSYVMNHIWREHDVKFRVKVPLSSATARTEPQTVRCIAKSKEYLPADGGLNPYIAVYPVLGTTVTVICPPHYEVDIDLTFTLHPNDLTEKIQQPQGTKWLIKSPMLPGQGFFIRWAKQSPTFQEARESSI